MTESERMRRTAGVCRPAMRTGRVGQSERLSRRSGACVLVLAGTLHMLAGCGGGKHDRTPGSDADRRFVGGDVCAECHAAEYQRWRGSHHDLAMQPATPETVLGDFDDASFEYGETVTTFYRAADQFLVRTDGPDGELAEFPISYTFGVTPLQQYLIEFPDGRMQALGIAWDSRPAEEGGQRWFHLYPDEHVTHDDPLHWTRSYQNWNHMCAECHSTDLRKNYRQVEDRFETAWSDIDVSCEACHGPGSQHVEIARGLSEGEGYSEDSLRSLMVRLRASDLGVWTMDSETGTAVRGSLSREPFLDVCAPCHSRRTSISQHVIPGRPFLATHRPALLDDGLYFADGQMLDEVYVYGSFIQSKMHEAGVTCANCHDSHGLQIVAEGNALCAQCHLASRFDSPAHHFHKSEGEGAQCVACHMPTRTYMGVDVRRDHSMRIPRPDLSVKIGSPNACNACHDDRTAEWAAQYAEQWYGVRGPFHFGETFAAARRADPESVDSLISIAVGRDLPGMVRATAVALLGGFPRQGISGVLERAAQDVDPLVRLAAARALAFRGGSDVLRIGVPLLSDSIRAVRTEIAQVLATGSAWRIPPEQRQAFERVLNEYRESLRLHADRPESHLSLALLDAAAERYADAERELRTAIRLDSYFVAAYVNLADLLRVQRRDAEGEVLLREGLGVDPQSAVIHHSLGLLLVRGGRRDEGLTELETAAELAPDSPRFLYAYAIGLHSSGETSRALSVLARAIDGHPYDADLLSALVSLNLEVGKREAALGYARRLARVTPEDTELAEFIEAEADL